MQLGKLIRLGLVLGVTAGCCREPAVRGPCTLVTIEKNGALAVAVAEKSIRSPDMTLPLTPAERGPLAQYLQAGGKNDIQGEDATNLDVGQRYAGLFDALANVENLDIEDLESPTYATWFKTKPIVQVIDAREDTPAEIGSVRAFSDGTFWWVFRRVGAGKFSRLVVFPALGDNK